MAASAKAKNTSAQPLTDKQLRFRKLLAQGAREGAVIALIALAIYLSMALFSFHADDPGWASVGHDARVLNHAGRRVPGWPACCVISLVTCPGCSRPW